jgi:hypothetical protein
VKLLSLKASNGVGLSELDECVAGLVYREAGLLLSTVQGARCGYGRAFCTGSQT